MRHIAFIPLLIIMLLTSGCTQNNGEIDPWFGTWRLESLTCDGEPSDDYHGQMTWSFQNDIICLVTDLGHHSYTHRHGAHGPLPKAIASCCLISTSTTT